MKSLIKLFGVLGASFMGGMFSQDGFASRSDYAFFSKQDQIVAVLPWQVQLYDADLQHSFFTRSSASRLELAAGLFLGKPYFLEPLGEGKNSLYSEEPLYRTDRFDCVTYVDTILALTASRDLPAFKNNIVRIRYTKGQPDYFHRTEWFTDLEWIPNARQLGWIINVTPDILSRIGEPVEKIAVTTIDKPNWYKVRPLQAIHRLPPLPEGNAAISLLEQLHAKSEKFTPQDSALDYLPLTALFDALGNPDLFLFNQIPSGSVVAIVRPDWPIRDHFPGLPNGYGTNLNVSHLGIVLRTAEGLQFYNASSLHGKVMVEPLIPYLKKYLNSETVKGIHVEKIIIDKE